MTYQSEVLADSPLAYWRFNDGATGTALDSSGNAHTLTLTSSAGQGATGLLYGDTDKSWDAPATSQAYIGYGAWQTTTNFSIDGWINADALTTRRTIVSRDGSSVPFRGNYWNLYVDTGNLVFWDDRIGGLVVRGSSTLVTGTTYHVAVTYDGTNVRLYVNGALDGTSGSVSVPNNSPDTGMYVGFSYAGLGGTPSYQFDGRIDEIAYYGTALSATRLLAHYTAGKTPTGSQVGQFVVESLSTAIPAIRAGQFTVEALQTLNSTSRIGQLAVEILTPLSTLELPTDLLGLRVAYDITGDDVSDEGADLQVAPVTIKNGYGLFTVNPALSAYDFVANIAITLNMDVVVNSVVRLYVHDAASALADQPLTVAQSIAAGDDLNYAFQTASAVDLQNFVDPRIKVVVLTGEIKIYEGPVIVTQFMNFAIQVANDNSNLYLDLVARDNPLAGWNVGYKNDETDIYIRNIQVLPNYYGERFKIPTGYPTGTVNGKVLADGC